MSWLEEALRVERETLAMALAKQHISMLQLVGPELQDVRLRLHPPTTALPNETDSSSSVTGSSPSREILTSNNHPGHSDDGHNDQTCPALFVTGPESSKEPPDGLWRHPDNCSGPPCLPMDSIPELVSVSPSNNSCRHIKDVLISPMSSARAILHAPSASEEKTRRRSDLAQRQITFLVGRNNKSPAAFSITGSSSLHRERNLLVRMITGPAFETLFGLLILANCLVMALEAQYHGIEHAYKVGYPGSTRTAEETWPGAVGTFKVLEWIFGICFTMELLLKLLLMRKKFFFDPWNYLDVAIVGSWIFDTLTNSDLPVDPLLLRLARLTRLLRLLKVVRTIQLFDSLFLMTTAMRASFSALFWSIVLLSLVQMLLALTLQKMVESYILDESSPKDKRVEVYKYFGSFARSMLTMFEITLGNWMPPCRALVENVSEWYMLFSIIHKLIIGFSVLSVLNAVFIQETFKVASIDDRIMLMSRDRARKIHAKKIWGLFCRSDGNHDGFMEREELEGIFDNPDIRMWLAAMDLDVDDYHAFFQAIDRDCDGRISYEELVQGVARMKGYAKSFELAKLQSTTHQLRDIMQEVNQRLSHGSTFSLHTPVRPVCSLQK
eukprot:CAMPEP_0172911160 /NCGR_PEP_ID=MMETSP1075-20121228/185961_1 /TAXON_ID=2916 /ORGANISM="Ceratium fusus, Strain PA161109" /LENGTH=608 /DNA_ID=CAMNT_0013769415 /DNA_START=135 /DNA_END=1958 /DNA_ORIENTATION=+